LLSAYSHGREEPLTVQHYQYQSRYAFGHELLQLALSYSKKPYEIIDPMEQSVNEARGEHLVVTGELDVQWLSTSPEREKKLIAIPIPVYNGILGLRLLLSTKENRPRLSKIRNIESLREYTGGHGSHWQDLVVYKENQLPVKTYGSYQALFKQLEENRFDYFHRGMNEIWSEVKRHESTLAVVDNLMLFYPHPVYFFVTKGRPKLTNDIRTGLQLALQDGSFKRAFLTHHQSVLDESQLSKRTLIRLQNSAAEKTMKHMRTEWWLPRHLNP
jgi:hypothetical protein